MVKILSIFTTLFLLVLLNFSAHAEEGVHSVGVQGGQVLLSGEVLDRYSNALGIGGFFNYAASDFLEFQLAFNTSNHTSNSKSLNRQSYELGVIYNIDEFDIFVPYLKGGAELIAHKQDFVGANGISTNGFGLNFGVGSAVLLGKDFMTGLELTYHSAFDVSYSAGGVSQKAIQPYTTVMVLFGYRFSSSSKK